MTIQGTYKKDDCEIHNCSIIYETGEKGTGNSLLITFVGIGTKNNLYPNEQDGFSVYIPTPENILTIGEDGLVTYIIDQLQPYKI